MKTRPRIYILCNSDAAAGDALTIESNAYSVAAETMLIPYGDHPHKNGVQRLTRETAETMVSNFNGFLAKLGRLFGGMPVYIGHPDDPAFSNQHTDARAYAWIMGMEAREDGLALIPKWSKPGEEIVSNAHYKWFSPRWACKEIGRENGRAILAPARLISVGLTNMPNIAGIPPLANEDLSAGEVPADQPEEPAMDLLKRLLALLGMPDTASAEDLVAKVTDLSAKTETATSECNAAVLAATEARAALANAEAARASERGARIELLVSNAIAAGRITPAQKDQWIKDLAEQFDAKSIELSNAKPVLHVAPVTAGLGSRKVELQTSRDTVLTLVNQRIEQTGEDYETAFASVRKENAALFEAMKQPSRK
jgi:phage I-like protein